jgi:hypothetical protein
MRFIALVLSAVLVFSVASGGDEKSNVRGLGMGLRR